MDLMQQLTDAKAQGWSEWIRSSSDERAVSEGCTFDLPAAERVQTFFKKFLRHSKGQWSGQPFKLIAGLAMERNRSAPVWLEAG